MLVYIEWFLDVLDTAVMSMPEKERFSGDYDIKTKKEVQINCIELIKKLKWVLPVYFTFFLPLILKMM